MAACLGGTCEIPLLGCLPALVLDCYKQTICYSGYLSLVKKDSLFLMGRKEIAFLHGNVAILAMVALEM